MRTLSCFVVLSALLVTASAHAHIQLTSPTARYTQDNNGLKTAPCGSGTRTGVVTKVSPGQTLTVTWKESVSHAGHYRIALSASESDFVEPTSLTVPSTLPSWDLADGIQDRTGTQTYSQTVQIPQKECPTCVLQLIQVMSAGSDGTNTGAFSGVYHACADLSITGAAGDASVADVAVGSHDASAARDGQTADVQLVMGSGDGSGQGGSLGTGTGGSGGLALGTGGAASTQGSGGSTNTMVSGGRRSETGGITGTGGAMTGSGGMTEGAGTGGTRVNQGAGGSGGGGSVASVDGRGGSTSHGNAAGAAGGCNVGGRGGFDVLGALAFAGLLAAARVRRRRSKR